VVRARALAKQAGCDLAIIDKRRISGEQTVIEHVIGDVKNRDVLLVDDMVSTGGSIVDAARIVKEKGARKVFIVATHAVLSGNAVQRLNGAEVEKILFADTVPVHDKGIHKLEVCSMAQLLARAIDRIHRSESVSKLFESER
jgi:ribose-phosphate pyrophosphokinase